MPSDVEEAVRLELARLVRTCHQLENAIHWRKNPKVFAGLLDKLEPLAQEFLAELAPLRDQRDEAYDHLRRHQPRKYMAEMQTLVSREAKLRSQYQEALAQSAGRILQLIG